MDGLKKITKKKKTRREKNLYRDTNRILSEKSLNFIAYTIFVQSPFATVYIRTHMLLVYFFVTKAELPATNEATLRPCVYHIS
jgi:hypothetical protein